MLHSVLPLLNYKTSKGVKHSHHLCQETSTLPFCSFSWGKSLPTSSALFTIFAIGFYHFRAPPSLLPSPSSPTPYQRVTRETGNHGNLKQHNLSLRKKKKNHKKSLSCLYQATGSKEGKQLFGARKQKICLLFAGSACATSPGQCSPPAICFAWPKLHVPLQSQCGSRSSVSVSLSRQEQSDTLGQLPSQHLTSCYYHSFLVAPSLSVSPF